MTDQQSIAVEVFDPIAAYGQLAPYDPEIVDQLSPEDLIAPYVAPSRVWWRRTLFRVSGRRINVGESPKERQLRKLDEDVSVNLRDTYVVVVLGSDGGVGKTTATTVLRAVFDEHRDDGVIAVDVDPKRSANLANRIDPLAARSVREIGADKTIARESHLRELTSGLRVVASPQHVDPRAAAVTADDFDAAYTQLAKYCGLIFVDCGTDLDHAAMGSVLDHADAVVLVTTASADRGASAFKTLQWLIDHDYHDLLSRLVVIINHDRPYYSRKDQRATRQRVKTVSNHRLWGATSIEEWPFDPHLADGGVVRTAQLGLKTSRRVLETAARVAAHFSAK